MQHAIGSHHAPHRHSRHGRAVARTGRGTVRPNRTQTTIQPRTQVARSEQAHPTLAQRAGRIATSRGVREVAIVGVAVYLYFFVRGLMHGQEHRAFEHARWLVDFEQRLGFFWEPRIQEWALSYDWLGTAANWVYIWAHWPVIVATLTWLLVRHRDQYPIYRNAMLISGGIGLVCFMVWPMAPPRFLGDLGFIDTVTLHSNAYRVLQPPSLTNQYAAMPSLHCGWDLLMGIAIVSQAQLKVVRFIGIILPLLMISATVLTANHYISDGLVGMSLATFGLVAARYLDGFSLRPRAKNPEQARTDSGVPAYQS
jgi:membrane-associated phospholipid phosphatase